MGAPLAGAGIPVFGAGVNRETLSGAKTLTADDAFIQSLDPDGAKDVILPAEEAGLAFLIVNRASGAENITLEADDNTALATISQYDAALVISDGTGWAVILGAAATVQE